MPSWSTASTRITSATHTLIEVDAMRLEGFGRRVGRSRSAGEARSKAVDPGVRLIVQRCTLHATRTPNRISYHVTQTLYLSDSVCSLVASHQSCFPVHAYASRCFVSARFPWLIFSAHLSDVLTISHPQVRSRSRSAMFVSFVPSALLGKSA